MIVPLFRKSSVRIKPGDKVTVTTKIYGPYFMVLPGHVLTYIGSDPKHNPGEILKDEETGLLVKRVSILSYELYQPDLKQAKERYDDYMEEERILKYIKTNDCSQQYRKNGNTLCKLKTHNCSKKLLKDVECKHNVSCIEYTSEKSQDGDFILKLKRKMKMKKLKKEIKNEQE